MACGPVRSWLVGGLSRALWVCLFTWCRLCDAPLCVLCFRMRRDANPTDGWQVWTFLPPACSVLFWMYEDEQP